MSLPDNFPQILINLFSVTDMTNEKAPTLEPFEFKGKFKPYLVVAVPGRYANGRKAIRLLDSDDGSLVAVATVNIPDAELGDDEVFIKDYSENEGVLDSLIDAGFIDDAYGVEKTGFVVAHRCKLTAKGLAIWE